ncbi:MAG: hypothetical protein DWP97_04220 [Calditrichaeota bacterium]|nr:MAG: hypothetical protein DWP97_04220 [Calditrichota bacterium]
MTDNIDKRNRLEAEPFSYKTSKDGKLFIFCEQKQVMVLKDKKAQTILKKIENKDSLTVQLVLAKVTGNFKHGNER